MVAPIMGAMKYLPVSLGVKLLQKVNPKFKNYFTTAAAYGYDANNALDYLKDRFENQETESFENQLEKGATQGTLRPDEMAAKSQIANSQIPGKAVRSVAAFGGAALAGGLPGAAAAGASQAMQQPQQQLQQEQPLNPQQEILQKAMARRKKPLREKLEEQFEAGYSQGSEKERLIQLTQEGLAMLQRLNQGR